AAGIRATVNSDDPAYFGGYMNANFLAAGAALPRLGAADAYALAKNSVDASFVGADVKAAMTARLDQVFARFACARRACRGPFRPLPAIPRRPSPMLELLPDT